MHNEPRISLSKWHLIQRPADKNEVRQENRNKKTQMPKMPNAKTRGNPLENIKLSLVMCRSTHLKTNNSMRQSISWTVCASLQCQQLLLFQLLPHRLSQPGFSHNPSGTTRFNLPFEDVCQIALHALHCFSDLCTSPPAGSAH